MKRRQFLQSCAVLLSSGSSLAGDRLFTPASRPAPGIIDIGGRKQAFLDDFLVFEASKVRPVMTRPDTHEGNPVIAADRPWEHARKGVWLSGQAVLYDEDEKVFKMWYTTPLPGRGVRWCYAISRDGQHWEKPELGIHEFEGSKKNNIICTWDDPEYSSVMKDARDPDPARRYKAMGGYDGPKPNHTGGAVVAFSPDGLHWTEHPGNPVIKHGPGLDPEIYGTGDHRNIRSHAYSTSDDFIHWTPSRLMLTPDAAERFDHQYLTLTDAIDGEFYVGLNGVLKTVDQSVAIHLMSSRDGFHWTWVDHEVPFLGRAEIGVRDDGRMTHSVPQAPITRDGKVFVYYTAQNHAHSHRRGNTARNVQTIALSTLPRDRWVGLVAGPRPHRATIVTHTLLFRGSKLMVDLRAATSHQPPRIPPRFDECDVRLALEDQSGEQYEGFTIDRCQPLLKSGMHEVRWRGADVGRLEGKRVRVRFEMRNAALYTFQFV